jgi:hypothetical protein
MTGKKNSDNELTQKARLHQKLVREAKAFRKQFSASLLKLVTSGFGLVSALAWNELIKESINTYVKPFFGKDSGLVSLFIYALFVTLLAVFITYQLTRLVGKEKK